MALKQNTVFFFNLSKVSGREKILLKSKCLLKLNIILESVRSCLNRKSTVSTTWHFILTMVVGRNTIYSYESFLTTEKTKNNSTELAVNLCQQLREYNTLRSSRRP